MIPPLLSWAFPCSFFFFTHAAGRTCTHATKILLYCSLHAQFPRGGSLRATDLDRGGLKFFA